MLYKSNENGKFIIFKETDGVGYISDESNNVSQVQLLEQYGVFSVSELQDHIASRQSCIDESQELVDELNVILQDINQRGL